MKINKRVVLFTFLFVVLVLISLSGCMSKIKNESQITSDLSKHTFFTESNFIIDTLKIEKRQTNKEDKNDNVFCLVTYRDKELKYIQQMELKYVYYDEGGWILDNIVPEPGVKKQPITGVNDAKVVQDFTKGEGAYVLPVQILYDNIAVVEHNTDLANRKDVVTLSLSKKSPVLSISGSVIVEYGFDASKGAWIIQKFVSKNKDYTESWNFAGTWKGSTQLIGTRNHRYTLTVQDSSDINNIKAQVIKGVPQFIGGTFASGIKNYEYNVIGKLMPINPKKGLEISDKKVYIQFYDGDKAIIGGSFNLNSLYFYGYPDAVNIGNYASIIMEIQK